MRLKRFDDLVNSFANLPGVGKKSAQKYAYFAALSNPSFGQNLAHQINEAIRFLRHCSRCGFITENELCDICTDDMRNNELLCIVENPKDIITIENSNSYDGLYFVLKDINNINSLQNAIKQNKTKEIIFALTPSLSNDGLMLLIENQLQNLNLTFSKIAQGIPTGVSLENIDILSLSKALKDRNSI